MTDPRADHAVGDCYHKAYHRLSLLVEVKNEVGSLPICSLGCVSGDDEAARRDEQSSVSAVIVPSDLMFMIALYFPWVGAM